MDGGAVHEGEDGDVPATQPMLEMSEDEDGGVPATQEVEQLDSEGEAGEPPAKSAPKPCIILTRVTQNAGDDGPAYTPREIRFEVDKEKDVLIGRVHATGEQDERFTDETRPGAEQVVSRQHARLRFRGSGPHLAMVPNSSGGTMSTAAGAEFELGPASGDLDDITRTRRNDGWLPLLEDMTVRFGRTGVRKGRVTTYTRYDGMAFKVSSEGDVGWGFGKGRQQGAAAAAEEAPRDVPSGHAGAALPPDLAEAQARAMAELDRARRLVVGASSTNALKSVLGSHQAAMGETKMMMGHGAVSGGGGRGFTNPDNTTSRASKRRAKNAAKAKAEQHASAAAARQRRQSQNSDRGAKRRRDEGGGGYGGGRYGPGGDGGGGGRRGGAGGAGGDAGKRHKGSGGQSTNRPGAQGVAVAGRRRGKGGGGGGGKRTGEKKKKKKKKMSRAS